MSFDTVSAQGVRARLAYANIFACNIDALAQFYSKLFGFPLMADRASPIYRCLDAGGGLEFGFNAPLAYDLLGVADRKKRFLGEATAFDMILVIMLGSIAARALTAGAPYFPSVLGMVLMIAMHWLFSYMARDSQWFSGLIKGHSTVLIRDGRIDHPALKDAHMSRDDLDEDLRQHGIRSPEDVAEARLERNGHLSVIEWEKAA